MIVETSLQALQEGQQVQLAPGDTLRVSIEIAAIMPVQVTTELWVSLVIEPGRDYTVKKSVTLLQSDTEKTCTETVDMPIAADTGLKNMTYDLWAELPAYDAVVKVPGAVSITGMSGSSLLDMMPVMVMVMMMGMMMSSMEE